jgi:hypothetical protein
MPEPTVIDTLPEEIRTALPAEMLTDANITKYKTLPDLLNGHVNLSKMISAKGVIVPKDDDASEVWDKFYNTLGRPEKADGYKLSELKDLHPNIKPSDMSKKAFLDFAHKNGMTAKQVDETNKWYLTQVDQMMKAQDKAWNDKVTALETKLKTDWGADYEKKKTLAATLVAKAGGQDVIDGMGDAINNPAVLRFLADVGAHFAEDDFKNLGITPKVAQGGNDALAKIKAIQADIKHAYWNEKDPKHDEAVQEYTKLYQEAYPEGSTI